MQCPPEFTIFDLTANQMTVLPSLQCCGCTAASSFLGVLSCHVMLGLLISNGGGVQVRSMEIQGGLTMSKPVHFGQRAVIAGTRVGQKLSHLTTRRVIIGML